MHSQNIQLKDLHVSPLNMRAKKKQPSLQRMAKIAAKSFGKRGALLPTVRSTRGFVALAYCPLIHGRVLAAARLIAAVTLCRVPS